MVSKPWHYSDCRLQEYFWESAEKSSVYAEIRQVLESYTDEERKRDAVSCDRLMQTAKDEIAKENNYLNLVKAGKLKSKDRLEVLEKIALYEREGRFGEDVEEDPPTRELQPSEIDYLRKKLKSRINGHKATISEDYQNLKEIVLEKRRDEMLDKWIREKQKHTYVRINENWKNCTFKYPGWIKD